MTSTVIINTGRVGDRSNGLIAGAIRSGQRFSDLVLSRTETVGYLSEAREDGWEEALQNAQPTLESLAQAVEQNVSKGNFIGIFSSTCSSGIASMPKVVQEYKNLNVIYIDGHGDFNIPSMTETGYLGGMVLSGVCGLWSSGYGAGVDPSRVTLVGSRDLDSKEKELLDEYGISVFPQINIKEIVSRLNGEPVWIHIDWDSLEPGYVPADYTVPGGLMPADVKELIKAITASESKLIGFEISEFLAVEGVVPTADESLNTIMDILSPLHSYWKES